MILHVTVLPKYLFADFHQNMYVVKDGFDRHCVYECSFVHVEKDVCICRCMSLLVFLSIILLGVLVILDDP